MTDPETAARRLTKVQKRDFVKTRCVRRPLSDGCMCATDHAFDYIQLGLASWVGRFDKSLQRTGLGAAVRALLEKERVGRNG